MVKKIVFVQDITSKIEGEKLVLKLENAGVRVNRVGTIAVQAEASEEEIIASLKKLIFDADIILGVSSSGNGISIYGNKIEGIKAVPIVSEEDIKEAINQYSCNLFDVVATNKNAQSLLLSVVKEMGGME